MNIFRTFRVAALLVTTIAFGQVAQAAKAFPAAPKNYVYDETGILKSHAFQISNSLSEFDRASGTQILVAVFQSLDQEDLVDFTNKLFSEWKIGQAKKDNGLLLAIFQQERKIRIEVGYGLEPVITDAYSKRIIETFLGPAFREGQYGAGVLSAVEALQQKIATGEDFLASAPTQPNTKKRLKTWVFLAFFLLFIFLKILSGLGGIQISHSGRSRNWSRNSGFGGFGGPFGGGPFGGGGFGGGGFGGGGGRSGGGGASGGW